MNVTSVATAISSGIKAAEGPVTKDASGKTVKEKNADGTTKTRWQAMKEEARATGGPLKAFGSVLVQGTRSQLAWSAHKGASEASKGKGAGAYAAELKSRMNPQQSVSAGGAQTSGAPRYQAGQMLTTGSGRSPDVGALIGKFGKLGAFAILFATGNALGRIVDSYATIGAGKAMTDRLMDNKGSAALNLREDLQAADIIRKTSGVTVDLPNGGTGILAIPPGRTETIDPKTGMVVVTAVYKVLPENSPAILDGKLTPQTVTVVSVREPDSKGGGTPALTNTSTVTIRVVTSPEKVDSSGKVIKEAESKEYQVFAKMEGGKTVFFIKTDVAGKPVEVPVKVEANNTLSVQGRRVDIVQGAFSMEDTSRKVRDFGVSGDKMVVGDPVVKIASVETAFALAGSKEEVKVNIMLGKGPAGQESTIVVPKELESKASMIKGYAEGVAINTLGMTGTLSDKGDASSLLNAQKVSMDTVTQLGESIKANIQVIQRDKTDDWNNAEKKAWGELVRDHPEVAVAVKKGEQDVSADFLASRGITFNPADVKALTPEETKGRAFASSNSEAVFDINKALESSVFVDPKKSLQMGEGIAAKAGTPLQGDVFAAAVDMMVNPRKDAKGEPVTPPLSIDDLKKMDPDSAQRYIRDAVNEAANNHSISPAEASRLMSPAAAKEFTIAVQVEAKSAGDILAMLPKSNVAQVPVAELSSIRNEAFINAQTDTVSTTAACERAGVPVPPSLIKMNSERESLRTASLAAEQMSTLASEGKLDQRVMDRVEVMSRASDNYMLAGFADAVPKIPKDATTSLNSADSQRGQLARADAAMLESSVYTDQNGRSQIREGTLAAAFTQKLDENASKFKEALNPEKPDFVTATKIAHETEGMCRDVGDNKAASTWNYLGEAPSVLASEQISGRFSPTADERAAAERAAGIEREKILRAAVPVGPPTQEQQDAAEKVASKMRDEVLRSSAGETRGREAYEASIYTNDFDPKKGVIPSAGDIAMRAEAKLNEMSTKVGQMEEQAAKIVEAAAKKSAGPPERKLGKKSDES